MLLNPTPTSWEKPQPSRCWHGGEVKEEPQRHYYSVNKGSLLVRLGINSHSLMFFSRISEFTEFGAFSLIWTKAEAGPTKWDCTRYFFNRIMTAHQTVMVEDTFAYCCIVSMHTCNNGKSSTSASGLFETWLPSGWSGLWVIRRPTLFLGDILR